MRELFIISENHAWLPKINLKHKYIDLNMHKKMSRIPVGVILKNGFYQRYFQKNNQSSGSGNILETINS